MLARKWKRCIFAFPLNAERLRDAIISELGGVDKQSCNIKSDKPLHWYCALRAAFLVTDCIHQNKSILPKRAQTGGLLRETAKRLLGVKWNWY